MGYAKWILGGLGFVLSGPIGAVVGALMGTVVDNISLEELKKIPGKDGDFGVSLLILSAAVVKADGKIDNRELDYVEQFLEKNFGKAQAGQSMVLLKQLLDKDYSIRQVALQIKKFMDHSTRLQLLHYLFGISQADGKVDPSEVDLIQKISGYLGINFKDFESLKNMFYKDVDSAYKILEIEKTCSDLEVKKAYRKMALKYHPDKVAHLGESHQKAAQEKFQKVQEAYEQISAERGMK